MKFVKGFLIVFVVLAIAGYVGWQFWGKKQIIAIQIGTAYTAKHVCSCRFVAKRDLSSCRGDFTLDISELAITENGLQITSTAPLSLSSSRAVFTPGLGCSLVPTGN